MLKRIINHIRRRLKTPEDGLVSRTTKRLDKLPAKLALKEEEVQQINSFYKKYGFENVPLDFHRFYKSVTGRFDVRFLPETIYYRAIDHFYNNWDMAKFLDNKTFYQWFFSDAPQPVTIGRRMNGFWYDHNSKIVSADDIIRTIGSEGCFCKIATESYGGRGVKFCNTTTSIEEFIKATDNDIIIQQPLKQHELLASISPSSINTLRFITLLRKSGEVKIYSTILRMGIGDSKVDNATSGGITVGVDATGKLNKYAYSVTGNKYQKHPTSGFVFDGKVIPGIEKARNLVLKQARLIPHFRLVSWDVAIDPEGTPILIEANLCDGELDFHQINNGPLFGNDTEEILREYQLHKSGM